MFVLNPEIKPATIHIPDYCVQGERIPFYVLWDKELKNQITITLPDGITLAEAYNINPDSLEINENVYSISNIEINGYVGGVFDSVVYDQASTTVTIKFQIQNMHDQQIYEKRVELFRPDVKLDDTIEEINIRTNKQGKPIVNGAIKIFNCGKGTAVVRIKILTDSEIKEGHPRGFEEFKRKFLKDLDEALLELKSKYAEFSSMLESMRSVIKNPLSTKITREIVRKTVCGLEDAFDSSENFTADFMRLIATAYFRNVSVVTDADSFLAFLKSTGKNKLLILDAMKVFKIHPGTQTLRAELQTTDLASNTYPLQKIRPITVTADAAYDIPFYQIIDFSGDADGR